MCIRDRYKIELVHVIKKYGCVTVEAETETEAIGIARAKAWEDFEITEESVQKEWQTNNNKKSFYDMLIAYFKGE